MGQKFMIKSDSSEDYIQRVAAHVDRKINEVMQNTQSVASLNVVILAAMNIADEHFKLLRDRDDRFDTAKKKVQNLIELIDLQM